MSNVSDKSFIYRSYPKLAYGSINLSPGCGLVAPGIVTVDKFFSFRFKNETKQAMITLQEMAVFNSLYGSFMA